MDIALLVLAVFVVLDHLQRIVVFLGAHGHARALTDSIFAFFNRFYSDLLDLFDNDAIKEDIG